MNDFISLGSFSFALLLNLFNAFLVNLIVLSLLLLFFMLINTFSIDVSLGVSKAVYK